MFSLEDQLMDWAVQAALTGMAKSDDLAAKAINNPCSLTKLKTAPYYPVMFLVLPHHID
jgi:hypothetical protein